MEERNEKLVMFVFADGTTRFVPESEATSFAANYQESDID